MASAELQVVLDMLRQGSPLAGETLLEKRATMEAATVGMPELEHVHREATDAGGVPAEWARTVDAADDGAVVYFHGGGYCTGSVHTHRLLVGGLAAACGRPVLSLGYRLAPEHPHPAAVEDAVRAYDFVRARGLAPDRIVFAGDSAGGGLTVGAMVALRDRGAPLPAAGVCLSPWTDLTLASESHRSKAGVDPLITPGLLDAMAAAYLAGAAPTTPTASPLHADLTGLPPLLVQVGSEEMLLDDARGLATRARAAGVDVTLEVWEEMFHVWHAFALLLPEGAQAIERVGTWVRARLEAGA